MICANCGYNNTGNGIYCGRCGKKMRPVQNAGSAGAPSGGMRGSGKILCRFCGTENPGTAGFCKNCGQRIAAMSAEASESDLTEAISMPGRRTGAGSAARLRLTSMDKFGQTFEAGLDRPVRIGRSSIRNNRIILSDPSVSREHCVVTMTDGMLYVRDLHSSNHTYINEKRISGETLLPEGGTLRLGNAAFLVDVLFGE